MTIVAVILAGGKSRRMGTDKSRLKINGRTLLEHIQKLLQKCEIKTIGISNNTHIQDSYENKGPLAGILSGLNYFSNFQSVLIIPVDMPLLNSEILLNLTSEIPQSITHYTEYNLPLFIKNSKEMRELIEKQIINNKLSIYQLLKQVNAKEIKNTFSNEYFINTNTPEQWKKTIPLLQE
jgi:molybdopterin-guanine dinucleotide biosynthesis protein A